MIKYILSTLLIISCFSAQAVFDYANNNKINFAAIVAGMNEGGRSTTNSFFTTTGLPYTHRFPENIKNTPFIESPDFGQDHCISGLESGETYNENDTINIQMIRDKGYNPSFFVGTSQGTATLINWLSTQPKDKQNEEVSGLFLESVLGSGNSAIMHSLENMPSLVRKSNIPASNILASIAAYTIAASTYLPFTRILLPYAASIFVFPGYKPFGMQPIDSAEDISTKLPIIIMHHKKDKQLSIDDARRVYCTLRNAGNENVYLFEIDGDTGIRHNGFFRADRIRHIDILDFVTGNEKEKIIKAVQAIYKKHDIRFSENSSYSANNVDLSEYQPTVEEVEQRIIHNSYKKTLLRNMIDFTAFYSLIGGISYVAYRCLKRAIA